MSNVKGTSAKSKVRASLRLGRKKATLKGRDVWSSVQEVVTSMTDALEDILRAERRPGV